MRRTTFVYVVITSIGLSVTAWSVTSEAQRKPPESTGATAPRTGIPAKNPIAVSDASVKAGRVVYSKICRDCHGLAGKGDGIKAPPGSKPANLVDAEWKYGGSDAEVFYTVKNGVKPFDVMEPWGKKISDTDIWNTINYLRDLAAKPAPRKAGAK